MLTKASHRMWNWDEDRDSTKKLRWNKFFWWEGAGQKYSVFLFQTELLHSNKKRRYFRGSLHLTILDCCYLHKWKETWLEGFVAFIHNAKWIFLVLSMCVNYLKSKRKSHNYISLEGLSGWFLCWIPVINASDTNRDVSLEVFTSH